MNRHASAVTEGKQQSRRGCHLHLLVISGRLKFLAASKQGVVQLLRKFDSTTVDGLADGVQFSPTNYGSAGFTNNQFLLAAGNRADLLVQAPTTPGVYSVRVMNEVDPRASPPLGRQPAGSRPQP